MNFLSVIGKKFEESGIEDLLTESGVYGSNTTLALLKGKSYNCGVHAHKLMMEALLRLQWQAFCKWLEKEREDHRLEGVDMSQIETNLDKFKESSATGEKKKVFHALCNSTQSLSLLLSRFKSESWESSQLFKFWNSYVEMVLVLLRFIRAEREGDWRLHLASTAEMTPYFFSMDRTNYSRWLPVYIADMHLLEDTAPEVHQEFMQGNHAVSRSYQPFSHIWTDMPLEQTVNLDSKTKGGIVGISQKPEALERWFLTAHERTAITTATKELCGICNSDSKPAHKEAGLKRINRDEEDVKKHITTVLSVLSNPFDMESVDDGVTVPLSNLAMGVVMPQDIATCLLNSQELGMQEMSSFITKRITSNETGFWDTLPKMTIETFASMVKKVQAKPSEEKLATVNADRNLSARLLIASKSRDINLRDLLKYELSSVPCALAHTDGSLRKNTKSCLLSVLEECVQALPRLPTINSDEPSTAYVLDDMAAVQMLKSAGARTFGEMGSSYFDVITAPLEKNNCV